MEKPRHRVEGIDISLINIPEQPLKENDIQLYQKLKRSIELRGQLKNIIVCNSTEEGKFDCIEGSKIVKILKELNFSEVLAINLGYLSEKEKELVRIEVFRDYFVTNYSYVGNVLKKLAENGKLEEICNTVPFDVRQAQHLISMTDFNWEEFNSNKQPEGQTNLFDLMSNYEDTKSF